MNTAANSLRSPLMAIVDADAASRCGRTMVDLASAYLDGGALLLQIRAKEAASGPLLEIAAEIAERAHQAKAIVIVNDRSDIARLSEADGVHVGQDDLPPAAARRVLRHGAIVGMSTHSDDQIVAALLQPIDYVAVGPVFETRSKETGYRSVGIEGVRRAAERTRQARLPLVAIGGITLSAAAEVLRAGADAVAVINDLLATDDPRGRVRAYLERLTL